MNSADVLLGVALAGLHWWQFDRFCARFPEHLQAGRGQVLRLAARRWMVTFLLGTVCYRWLVQKDLDFVVGFLVASFAARATVLIRHRVKI